MRLLAAALMLVVSCGSALAQQPGQPGRFDYYVLSLSWSPTWCATQAGQGDKEQCGAKRPHGFVVHGLWPQYAKGGYPAECAVPAPVPAKVEEGILPIMPSRKLIQHEWKKHGTCAGAAPESYFGTTRQAFEKIRIPDELRQPGKRQTMSVAEVETLFSTSNPGLKADAVSVVCRGRYAAEVRVCLDKDLNFRACGRDVQDRCKGDAIFALPR